MDAKWIIQFLLFPVFYRLIQTSEVSAVTCSALSLLLWMCWFSCNKEGRDVLCVQIVPCILCILTGMSLISGNFLNYLRQGVTILPGHCPHHHIHSSVYGLDIDQSKCQTSLQPADQSIERQPWINQTFRFVYCKSIGAAVQHFKIICTPVNICTLTFEPMIFPYHHDLTGRVTF